MKCVVTGASGHIGNVLIRNLINKKYEVKAFVLKNENVDYLKKLNVEICYGDVRDLESLKNAFRGADIVFHLAGIIDIGTVNKKFIYSINVDGTKNVLQACRGEKVKKLVYTSSVHAIPEKPKEEVITEITEFSENKVKGLYAKTKAMATKYLLENVSQDLENNPEIIIVHPSGVIGPFEYIPSNLGQLVIDCSNKKIGAYLDGGYNFVDVRDVANGIVLAAEKGKNGECYILAGHKVSVKELMLEIEKYTKVKMPAFKIARWFAYATGFLSEIYYKIIKQKPLFTSYAVYTLGTNCNFSNEKAKKELGYTIRPIDETIRDTIDWFREMGKIK